MNTRHIIYTLFTVVCVCCSCDNGAFIDELFVTPRAAFSIDDKEAFEVFEAVHFTNRGEGQKFVVYPGDESHVYGQKTHTGFASNSDGTFSYAYQTPGTYTAVWVASSIDASGEIFTSIDSTHIQVIATEGSLLSFSIPRLYKLPDFGNNFYYESYGKFVDESHIICPVPYYIWTKKSAIQRALMVKFALSSNQASLYWLPEGSEEKKLNSESTSRELRFDRDGRLYPQHIMTRTTSGIEEHYQVAAMLIPEFTRFAIQGVEAVQTRDKSAFNKFDMTVELPAGTDLSRLTPEFEVMGNDPDLLYDKHTVSVSVNGMAQISGQSVVDFGQAPVAYDIVYTVESEDGYRYESTTHYNIHVTTKQ